MSEPPPPTLAGPHTPPPPTMAPDEPNALLLPLFPFLSRGPAQGLCPPRRRRLLVSARGNRLLRLTHAALSRRLPFPGLRSARHRAGNDGSIYLVSRHDEVRVLDRKLAFVRRFSTLPNDDATSASRSAELQPLVPRPSLPRSRSSRRTAPTRNHVGHGVIGPPASDLRTVASSWRSAAAAWSRSSPRGEPVARVSGSGRESPGLRSGQRAFVGGRNSNTRRLRPDWEPAGATLRHAEINFAAGHRVHLGRRSPSHSTTNRFPGSARRHVARGLTPPAARATGLAFLPGVVIGSTGSPRLGSRIRSPPLAVLAGDAT